MRKFTLNFGGGPVVIQVGVVLFDIMDTMLWLVTENEPVRAYHYRK